MEIEYMKKRNYVIAAVLAIIIILLSLNFDGIASVVLYNKFAGEQSIVALQKIETEKRFKKVERTQIEEALKSNDHYFQSFQSNGEYYCLDIDVNNGDDVWFNYAEINSNILEKLQYSLIIGKYPNKPNEIMLTDYMIDKYMINPNKIDGHDDIYRSLIGKECNLNSAGFKVVSFKVVGF